MPRFAWRSLASRPSAWTRVLALAALAPALGACSSQLNLGDVGLLYKRPQLNTDWLTVSTANKEPLTQGSVTQDDLVGAGGQCGPAGATAAPAEGASADAPIAAGGVALQMTECEVVKRAGTPDNVEIGANERGERTVVMTYVHGARPGVYRFSGGRLASVERGPEPAAPARPQRPAPKAKKSGA